MLVWIQLCHKLKCVNITHSSVSSIDHFSVCRYHFVIITDCQILVYHSSYNVQMSTVGIDSLYKRYCGGFDYIDRFQMTGNCLLILSICLAGQFGVSLGNEDMEKSTKFAV